MKSVAARVSGAADSVASRRAGSARSRVLSTVFYTGLIVVMLLILTEQLATVAPAELARRIGFNSEGFTLALVLGAWIQFVRPRLTDSTRWPVTAATAVACAAVAVGLYTSDLPSRFKTLNEAFFALALILPYAVLTRPLRRWPPVVSALVLIMVVLGVALSPSRSPVVLLAETFAAVILVPLAFDVVDRGILDPLALTSAVLRYLWYAALVAIPVVVVVLGSAARTGGGWAAVLEYVGRVHEAVIGILLVQLFFAVGLGRVGRPSPSIPSARSAQAY